MIDNFGTLMSNSILEKVVLTALTTAFDSRKEEVSQSSNLLLSFISQRFSGNLLCPIIVKTLDSND